MYFPIIIINLVIINKLQPIESIRHPTDCSTIVTSNTISYYGCKEFVKTDSLTNAKIGNKTIYSFKVSLNIVIIYKIQ